jgi:hypothetical protein
MAMESVATELTDVMFRVANYGGDGLDVYALFPGHAGTTETHTCLCYQHMGQHSTADLKGCIARSRPATEGEYRKLKMELERRGYVLNIISRTTEKHTRARREQCR